MTGGCQCGRVVIETPGRPAYLNVCNCTQCWRRGVLWGYFPQSEVRIEGNLGRYRREDIEVCLTTDFCSHCGVTTSWTPARADLPDRMGVNMRLFDARELAGIEVRYGNMRDEDGPRQFRSSTVFAGADVLRVGIEREEEAGVGV